MQEIYYIEYILKHPDSYQITIILQTSLLFNDDSLVLFPSKNEFNNLQSLDRRMVYIHKENVEIAIQNFRNFKLINMHIFQLFNALK
jgi:hypothetical protein